MWTMYCKNMYYWTEDGHLLIVFLLLLLLFICELHVQWNLGIRDTQGTVQNCPQF